MKAPGVSPEARTAQEDDTAGTEAQTSLEEFRADLIATVTNHGQNAARRGDPEGFDVAVWAIRRVALNGGEFTADDIYHVAYIGSTNAVGAAFSYLRKQGEITCIGYRRSTRLARHGGIVRVWRAV
jgi:hypothetical protein